MIEKPMPQDIMKFKAKLMAGLSARQIIWGTAAGAVAIGCNFLLADAIASTQTRIIVAAIPALPFFMIGFMDVMGMPMEKVAIPMLIDNFIAPPIRKKEIRNPQYEKFRKAHYGEFVLEEEEEEAAEEGKKPIQKKKKNSVYKCKKSKEYIGIK